MMVLTILCFLVFLIWESISWLFNKDVGDVPIMVAKIASFIRLIMAIIIFILFLIIISKPTAMQVYQGKTTLEITYKNGVPIDSVVVYKDK